MYREKGLTPAGHEVCGRLLFSFTGWHGQVCHGYLRQARLLSSCLEFLCYFVCVFRLVRVCLGVSAIAAHKLDYGRQVVILGIEIAIKPSGIACWPSPDKIIKWTRRIARALKSGRLCPGDASKLSGALMWATQSMFKRLGRAMLRPIMRQSDGDQSKIGKELELALKWWLEVFDCNIKEERSWHQDDQRPIHMYTDARSTPPRVAAVLLKDGYTYYADLEPSPDVLKHFHYVLLCS